jgi:hypothetical protein
MDGLVSTGKQISLHNIRNNFPDLKNFLNKFYSHFITAVDKGQSFRQGLASQPTLSIFCLLLMILNYKSLHALKR